MSLFSDEGRWQRALLCFRDVEFTGWVQFSNGAVTTIQNPLVACKATMSVYWVGKVWRKCLVILAHIYIILYIYAYMYLISVYIYIYTCVFTVHMYVYLETWTDDPHRRDEGPALHVSLMFQEVLKPPNSRALGGHFHYFGEICPKWLVFFSGEAWYWRLANSHWFATICSCFPSENEALQCFTCVPQINPLFNNTFFLVYHDP
jgi:hypothetical protein